MLEFIQQLKSSYERVALHCKDADLRQTLELRLASLHIAEAALQKLVLCSKLKNAPVHFSILGPTQAGKSTTVNLLLQKNQAGVSPLAGYTVHPQGFGLNVAEQELDWLQSYFEGFARSDSGIRGEPGDKSYAVSCIQTDSDHPLNHSVIWDTPDFDSLGAALYQEGVLKTAVLGEVILLVLSKDKYADQSVWDILRLLEPLACPTVICLNKISPEAEEVLVRSLQSKWRDVRNDQPQAILTFPYIKTGLTTENVKTELSSLYKALQKAATKRDVKKQQKNTLGFIRTHMDAWLEPVIAEHQAREHWQQLLHEKADEALLIYHRDYLNHPQHYETFNKALAELLTLLELPGVAKALAGLRKIVTWPMRQLFRIGKHSLSGNEDVDSLETRILGQVSDHFFIQLGESLLQQAEQDPQHAEWWRNLSQQLRQNREQVDIRFSQAVRDYHTSFQEDIHRTAYNLYNKLQEHPATLNSLRTTRVATDAAALALALHTGGIGVQDFVIAPAVLSITSMMTEGALGRHMSSLANKLKKTQRETVKESLFDGLLIAQLLDLPDQQSQDNQFNISADAVKNIQNKLGNSRYGLQLF
ncbi:MAG TPA: GTP-binding protein [Crenotrichaceae bacterium]|nr:GTP-binding protein [Crenotrichaceae bacterium]